ncbi:Predicted dehydrogenase [Thermanaeromonas toyohensis ToBE]|uniref:Predicted dehydrogenase n=2 Tax=Thermanaeromonas TaxID=202949 RepID=A0A1W1VW15_9FIRM|nr:Predicted dehydrogenase [Thermanaeromonas toyohensis ToBE]
MTLKLGIGMLGYGFMAKAHTNAYKKIKYIFHPFPAEIELIAICGRDKNKAQEAAQRYQYQKWVIHWQDLVEDESIQVLDNTATNDVHCEPCIAALEAGKHVIVEKPMALTLAEARKMYEVAKEAEKKGIKHMVAFNYRFVPALRLARKLINEGKLGRIYQFRSNFLSDRLSNPQAPWAWRLSKEKAGSGVLGDLNSHAIDMVRFLLQTEVQAVLAWNPTLISHRLTPEGKSCPVEVDDVSLIWLKLANGAVACLEASKVATGYKTTWRIEIHGSEGALAFDLIRGNELQFFSRRDPVEIQGFRLIHVTEPEVHDYISYWWPRGHGLGWEHYHINMLEHFLRCIATGDNVAPWGATFLDGLRCQEVIEAALTSSRQGGWIELVY